MDAAHHLLRLFLLALAQDHITGVKIVHQQPVTAGRYRASFKQRPPYCKQGGPQPGAIKQLIRTEEDTYGCCSCAGGMANSFLALSELFYKPKAGFFVFRRSHPVIYSR